MRRTMAFIAGMLFGMIFLVATLGVGIYTAISVIKPADVWQDSDKYLGDLSQMSVLQIIKEISDKYNTVAMNPDPETGEYYSVADFEKEYNINLSAIIGIELNDDVKKFPFLTLFTPDGLNKALQQTPVSAISGFLDFVGADAQTELNKHSIAELFGDNPMAVFNNVKLKDMIPDMVKDGNVFMVALGESKIGPAFAALTSGNVIAELLPDGAFETLGQVKFSDVLGEESALVNSVFADHQLVDIISENGSVVPEKLLKGLFVGDLVNYTIVYQCNGVDCDITSPDHIHQSHYWVDANGDKVSGMDSVIADISVDQLLEGNMTGQFNDVMLGSLLYQSKTVEIDDSYISISADGTLKQKTDGDTVIYAKNVGGVWYEATLNCTDDTHTDEHTADCARIVWYKADGTIVTDLTSVLGEVTIGELINGGANIEELFGDLKISEIMDVAGTIFEEFANYTFAELIKDEGFTNIQLGAFMDLKTVEVDISDWTYDSTKDIYTKQIDGVTYTAVQFDDGYFVAHLNCSTDHEHNKDCYTKQRFNVTAVENPTFPTDYTTVSGVASVIAHLTMKDIQGEGINEIINGLTIRDLMPDSIAGNTVLESISDIPLKDLSTGINNIYIGSLAGLHRKEVEDGTPNAIQSGGKWYEGELVCTSTDEGHVHGVECYNFVWYNEDGTVARGVIKTIANLTISEMTGDKLQQSINSMTLADVLGEENCSEGVLFILKDVQLSNLNAAIDNMYVGAAMGFFRKEVSSTTPGAIESDGKWYEGELDCKDESHGDAHTSDCYVFTWYNEKTCETRITGVQKIFANLTISQLSEGSVLQDSVSNLTLSEIGINVETGLLSALKDVKIKDLSTAIDNTYMGVAMGLFRKEVPEGTLNAIEVNGTWYEGQLICTDTSGDHSHTADCYGFVWYDDEACLNQSNRLNQLMANNKLSGMGSASVVNIVSALTMQDMMDAGIVNITPETEARLNSSMFFGSDIWKTYTLNEFMSKLFEKINSLPTIP